MKNVHLQSAAKARELIVHSRCHPADGTWVILEAGGTSVRLECVTCRKVVMTLRLAPSRLDLGYTDLPRDQEQDRRATGPTDEQARRVGNED